MTIKKITYILILSILCNFSLSAQNFSVQAEIDSVALLIGEQAKLSFLIQQEANSKISQPIFSDTIVTGLEVVERLKPDTLFVSPDEIRVIQSYVVTGFDSALIYVPSYAFGTGMDSAYSNSLTLKILPMPIDTTQQSITDIKPIYKAPFDWNTFFLWVLIIVLIIAAGLSIYFIYKRFKKKDETEESQVVVDNRPPHVIALEKLEEVRSENLWQQGRVKEYYTGLTDVIRLYLFKRYHMSAQESTTAEILSEVNSKKIITDSKANQDLKNVLHLADLVKFAKWSPLPDDNGKAYDSVYEFIQLTKQEESAMSEVKESDVDLKNE